MTRVRLVAEFVRIALGVVFLVAANEKFFATQPNPVDGTTGVGTFAAIVARHRVIPEQFSVQAAWGVLVFEVLLGAWLLFGRKPVAAVRVALASLVVFSLYLVCVYLRNGEPTCGCFGVLHANTLGWSIAVNAALIALSVWALVVLKRRPVFGAIA
jgi:uncharacterized membrane protein YphA (DoxX/SURF4 family)